MLYPTTVGTGPFKPAVAFGDTLFVQDTEYATEQEAYDIANVVYNSASEAFKDKLQSWIFLPRLHR